jgi:predicted RNA-binding protein
LHSTKWSDGKKKGWKPLYSKKNSIQDSVGNEENIYPVPDLNKTTINATKELSVAHKKSSKKKSGKKFIEKILDMVNQNVQDASSNFKIPKTNNMR